MAIRKESNVAEEGSVSGIDGSLGIWEASILFENVRVTNLVVDLRLRVNIVIFGMFSTRNSFYLRISKTTVLPVHVSCS